MSSPSAPITGFGQLHGAHAWRSSSSNTSLHPSDLLPSARHHLSDAQSSNRKEHDADSLEGRFPSKAYGMLDDKTMAKYVRWHQDRDSYGLFIPDIDAFVAYALPVHFPEMNKWGSFQKQLNNYGFEKQDRSATRAFYSHWNNKFRQGRPELLPEVVRRPDRGMKTATRQDAVQRPPATTPDVCNTGSQPLSLQELQARIRRLEGDNIHIRNENNQLKHENNQLRNEVGELRHRQLVSDGRLGKVETQIQEIMRKLAATSIGGDPFNPVGHPGLGVAVFNNNLQTNEARNPSGVQGGFPFKPQPVAYGGGAAQDVLPHSGSGSSYDTIDPALFGQPSHPQSSGFNSVTNPGISLSYPGGYAAPGGYFSQPFLMQNVSQSDLAIMHLVDPSSGHPQTSIPANGAPSFTHNTPTVTFTTPTPNRVQASNSPGVSGRRGPLGPMSRVPPLLPPNGSGR